MTDQQRAIAAALIHLEAARDLLKLAKTPKATAKVRAAITSTQNARAILGLRRALAVHPQATPAVPG